MEAYDGPQIVGMDMHGKVLVRMTPDGRKLATVGIDNTAGRAGCRDRGGGPGRGQLHGGPDRRGALGFVRRECARSGVASATATVTGLRSLLRFLTWTGRSACRWPAQCRRQRAGWQLAALPRAVSPAEVPRLMGSCDQDSAAGPPGLRGLDAAASAPT